MASKVHARPCGSDEEGRCQKHDQAMATRHVHQVSRTRKSREVQQVAVESSQALHHDRLVLGLGAWQFAYYIGVVGKLFRSRELR